MNARIIFLICAFAITASCGGGGGGGGGSAPAPTPPSDLHYPSPQSFVIDKPITPVTPTVTGQGTRYSVSPALPLGLSMNMGSGVISGTPAEVTAQATYTVTASNSAGSTTATIAIQVTDVAPAISYSSPVYALTPNVAALIMPTATGGPILRWSIAPSLPSELVFDTSTGTITGAPAGPANTTTYTVTATNSGGHSSATFSLLIGGTPVLNLGHTSQVVLIRATSSNLISLDYNGHWSLQDYTSGATLASGNGACTQQTCSAVLAQFVYRPVDVAGTTAVDTTPTGIEIRSTSDGHVLGTITGMFTWMQLASDGSYVSTGSNTALTVWNTSGQALFNRSGDYSKALVFSAPGRVQVALGPAGQNVIETDTVPADTPSVSPAFSGTFDAWFQDGSSFLTNQGTAVWVYSNTATQRALTTVANASFLGGVGNWIWSITDGGVDVYQVGQSSPAFSASYTEGFVVASGTTLGVVNSDTSSQVTVVDLSSAALASHAYTVPLASLSAFAAASPSTWIVGTTPGVMFDGASIGGSARYLALGHAQSIAAGSTGYFAVATASGQILYFNASTGAQAGTINFSSSQLSMSADGTVLAAAWEYPQQDVPPPNATVNVYSLPSGTVTSTFAYTKPTEQSVSLSASGTLLALVPSNVAGCGAAVVPASGSGSPIYCDTSNSISRLQLSPDGALIAAAPDARPEISTSIYKNGVLAAAVPGWGVGWLDNSRLLVNDYVFQDQNPIPMYSGAQIFNSSGTNLGSSAVPLLTSLVPVTTNAVYSAQLNAISSLTSGQPTWASGDPILDGVGAITSLQVVFASGNYVLAQSY
jgi:putative Ig domain-containing protein